MASTSSMFSGLITVALGLALLPVVQDFVAAAQNGTNSTSETLILGLISFVWIIGVFYAAAKMSGVTK